MISTIANVGINNCTFTRPFSEQNIKSELIISCIINCRWTKYTLMSEINLDDDDDDDNISLVFKGLQNSHTVDSSCKCCLPFIILGEIGCRLRIITCLADQSAANDECDS